MRPCAYCGLAVAQSEWAMRWIEPAATGKGEHRVMHQRCAESYDRAGERLRAFNERRAGNRGG